MSQGTKVPKSPLRVRKSYLKWGSFYNFLLFMSILQLFWVPSHLPIPIQVQNKVNVQAIRLSHVSEKVSVSVAEPFVQLVHDCNTIPYPTWVRFGNIWWLHRTSYLIVVTNRRHANRRDFASHFSILDERIRKLLPFVPGNSRSALS